MNSIRNVAVDLLNSFLTYERAVCLPGEEWLDSLDNVSRPFANVIGMVDGTTYRTNKPAMQRLYFSGHSKLHGVGSMMVIDIDGIVIMFTVHKGELP